MIIVQNNLANSNCPDNNWFIGTSTSIIKFLTKQNIITTKQMNSDLIIRIVSAYESKNLNKTYRNQDNPTNVLAFVGIDLADFPSKLQSQFIPQLGELIICFEIAKSEAKTQAITITQYLCYLIAHGILHLLGYDHKTVKQAQIMEDLEDKILLELTAKKNIS